MRITAIVENTTKQKDLATVHGLALYIETEKHKILFDVGPDDTLFHNAKALGIDLNEVDTVIISHGHDDHGGVLEKFLEKNKKAKVYIQEAAFRKHQKRWMIFRLHIGLDERLIHHRRIHLLHGDHHIDDALYLFTVKETHRLRSPANDTLLEDGEKDRFRHEQNLLISETDGTVLITGCGHTGIVNILDRAEEFRPDVVVGGFHLSMPGSKKQVPDTLLAGIAKELAAYPDTAFYTGHCTGLYAYEQLAAQTGNLHYLAAGESIQLPSAPDSKNGTKK